MMYPWFRTGFGLALTATMSACDASAKVEELSAAEPNCRALIFNTRTTLIYADAQAGSESVPAHCYVKGLEAGSITFHVQLPFPDDWNGRLVHRGDGGSDGDLDFSDGWVARGYAVVNSNTGHDVGATGSAHG